MKDRATIEKIRGRCLANAESLLSAAERELGHGVDHISFHLALLAFEEIGKAVLVTVGYSVSLANKEGKGLEIAMDDHVKKIFWALWGGILRNEKFTKEEIEQSQGLASDLHERRLNYLYIDPNESESSSIQIREGEAEHLIKLTRERLEIEKLKVLNEFTHEEAQTLKWFLNASEDPEKRREIFGAASMKKLSELGNGKEWINWLHDIFKKNEEEMRKLAQAELQRLKPGQKESFEPKYKMRVRIQSQSHPIRDNAFRIWNEGARDFKIYKVEKKNLPKYAKSELMIEAIFPKAVPIHGLWEHGHFIIKTLVIAFNIGTRGVFWWNVPKDTDRYFEEVTDLEADKNGSVKIGLGLNPRLSINWDEMKWTLDEEAMATVSRVFAFLLREHKKVEVFMQSYAMGMTIYSKIDIHLRVEATAFEKFFEALKAAFLIFNDWDGKNDFKETAKHVFEQHLPGLNELDEMIQTGLDLNPKANLIPTITLTEVVGMKLYCDLYLQIKISEYFTDLKNREPNTVSTDTSGIE